MLQLKYKNSLNGVKWLILVLTLLAPLASFVPAFSTVVPDHVGGSTPATGGGGSGGSADCTDGMYKDDNGNCACPPGTTATSDGSNGCEDAAIKCSNGDCDLIDKYVTPAITLFGAVFGTIAVASLIIGGIQYSSSEGDPQKVSNAKKRLTNTIIAIVAFLFLYSFLQFLVPGGIFNR
jgi:preprotein translocase subunit SecE